MRILLSTLALTLATPTLADPVHDATQRQLPELMTHYRDFHANPELSLHEVRSAGILAAEARKAGMRSPRRSAGPASSRCCATAPARSC